MSICSFIHVFLCISLSYACIHKHILSAFVDFYLPHTPTSPPHIHTQGALSHSHCNSHNKHVLKHTSLAREIRHITCVFSPSHTYKRTHTQHSHAHTHSLPPSLFVSHTHTQKQAAAAAAAETERKMATAAAERQEKKATAADIVAEARRKQMQQAAAAVNHCVLFAFDYGPSVSMLACACE